jgi:GNAT superfamily N-acetyltransferase
VDAFEIIKETLVDNPSVIFTVGDKGFFSFKVKLITQLLHSEASKNKGVYVDQSGEGVILFFEQKNKKSPSLFIQLLVILFAIGPFRLPRVWRRKQEVAAFHAIWPNYIYCSYLAVRKSARGQGAIFELRNALFQFQQEKQLPILVETTVEKNKRIYERIGFRVYDERVVSGFKTFCMVKEYQG